MNIHRHSGSKNTDWMFKCVYSGTDIPIALQNTILNEILIFLSIH